MDNNEFERRVKAAMDEARAKNEDPPPDWENLEYLVRMRIRREMQDEVERLIGLPSDEDSPPSAQSFLAMEFPARKPVLGPWCTQQLTFVYAPTGSYKSLFSLALAYALAEGQTFCGWESKRTQRVLYIDGEMAAADVQTRLKNAASERLFIANIPTWGAEIGIEPPNLATDEGQQLVTSWILKRDIDTVILDNLMSLAWKDGTSMVSDELWQPVRRWCIEQRSAERSVVLVDHTNASGEIFGSKTKLWHVDQAIRIDPVRDEQTTTDVFDLKTPERKFKMKFTKERGASIPQPEQIVTTADVGSVWTVESAANALEERAVEMKKDGLTIRDIAEELGTSKSTVGRWVRDVVPTRVSPKNTDGT